MTAPVSGEKNYTIVPVFADTNVIVHAFGNDAARKAEAKSILDARPVISSQVVAEFLNIARVKLKIPTSDRHTIARSLLNSCWVVALNNDVIVQAMEVEARYGLSYWDAQIIAAALSGGCDTLWSEDMQDGQVFEERLTLRNPLRTQR